MPVRWKWWWARLLACASGAAFGTAVTLHVLTYTGLRLWPPSRLAASPISVMFFFWFAFIFAHRAKRDKATSDSDNSDGPKWLGAVALCIVYYVVIDFFVMSELLKGIPERTAAGY